MKTDELREKYLVFFESKDHTRQPSDVLTPTWDPSVLFTPAGMNPFKDHFLGKVKLEFTRATSCQKCLRTGDIENVGRTAYHHTFFEMLGNFSFGDYFKRDAIHWAWEFLTSKQWLGLDKERFSASVYLDDDQAYEIWSGDIGLPSQRILRMGEDDNFWPASAPSKGPDGVCGPCSEIFYHPDSGPEVEIWNLVFTQFHRVGSPPDNLRPLPSKNIDTGMGLERMAACLQGVDTNYHIDILRPLVEAAAEACSVPYDPHSENGRRLRRIADHIRACTFAIHENVYPGPKKAKYVIRRLLRRAILDGRQLGVRDPFLYQLPTVVAELMNSAYPELRTTVERVLQAVRQEETAFFATLDAGLERMEKIFAEMERSGRVMVSGEDSGDLYTTYGVPPELTESIAAARKYTFDWEGFREWINRQKPTEDKTEVFRSGGLESLKTALRTTPFLGYESTSAQAEVRGILVFDEKGDDKLCERLSADKRQNVVAGHAQHDVLVVLNQSPFYAEAGGQVGDTGEIVGDGFRFTVTDTKKDSELIVHVGRLVEGEIHAGASVSASVDAARRRAIRRAHSATHLLHYALRKNLGEHAQQQGSKVEDDSLRFDFTSLAPVDDQQLAHIEQDVRDKVRQGAKVRAEVLPLSKAREAGAMMLFGEKYPDPVRMVSMGDFSKELCGGTHLDSTDQVGPFEVISEEGVSAGTRRVVAMTGEKAKHHAERTKTTLHQLADQLDVPWLAVPPALHTLAEKVRNLKKQVSTGAKAEAVSPSPSPTNPAGEPTYEQIKRALRDAARTLNVAPFDAPQRLEKLLAEVSDLEARVQQLKQSGVLSADALLEGAEEEGGVRIVTAETSGASPNLMRQLIDQLRQKAAPVAVLLAAREGDSKVVLVAGVSRDLVSRGVKAGDWVRQVAPIVGGGGGGKPDMAQAGGKNPQQLPEALKAARATIKKMLAAN